MRDFYEKNALFAAYRCTIVAGLKMFHPSEKQLLEYALLGDNKSLIESHVLECPDCHRIVNAAQKAVSSPIISIKNSDSLKNRILSTYDKIQTEHKTFQQNVLPFKKYLPFAVAAVIILAVSAVFLSSGNESASIVAQGVRGKATANSKDIIQGKSIKQGFKLVTGNESRLELMGKALLLKAGSDTSLVVKKAVIDKKTGRTVFDVTISHGLLTASFDDEQILKSTLRTPHARIISREGSHFVLSVDNDKTQLILKQGNASVMPLDGKSEVKLEEGYSYTVQNPNGSPKTIPLVEQREVSYSDNDDDDDLDEGTALFEN
jgi:hypothetical protein